MHHNSEGKKEDTSGEDKTDEKDKTDGKDQKTDDTSDGNASSGSSSSGNASGGTTVETPSKLTEADLLKQGYQLKWQDNFDGAFLNRADWNVELHEKAGSTVSGRNMWILTKIFRSKTESC